MIDVGIKIDLERKRKMTDNKDNEKKQQITDVKITGIFLRKNI